MIRPREVGPGFRRRPDLASSTQEQHLQTEILLEAGRIKDPLCYGQASFRMYYKKRPGITQQNLGSGLRDS